MIAACSSDESGDPAARSTPAPSPGAGSPPDAGASPGASLLFTSGAGSLSGSEQTAIFETLGFVLSEDGRDLVDGTCGQPVNRAVRFEDLNADGTDEVIVDYGNACISGMAGTSVMVFIRDAGGGLRGHLGVPGLIAEVLASEPGAYPNLLIGGPGFCFAVWGWDGEGYAFLRNEPQTPDGCAGR
jgi:hypothetical protein